MKVQWQLRDIETEKIIARSGDSFDLDLKVFQEKWEQEIIHGTGGKSPVGIIAPMRNVGKMVYYEQHAVCPKCRSYNIEQQLAPWVGERNMNRAICECGWTGVVHDLVPKGDM